MIIEQVALQKLSRNIEVVKEWKAYRYLFIIYTGINFNNYLLYHITFMQDNHTILEGYSDIEKGAYLGAIASIASADREASQEEINYLSALCDAAKLAPEQKSAVIRAATELTGEELNKCLDVLKSSNLKFSLVTDLMAFAKADNNYSEEEQQNVQKIAQYLQVNQQQFSLLDQFAKNATAPSVTTEAAAKPGFLSSLGLKEKMESAGINTNGLLQGLLGIAAPMILTRMLTGGFSRGGMFGGGMRRGGLGSIISMFNGGRGMGSTGGLFSRIFGGGFGF